MDNGATNDPGALASECDHLSSSNPCALVSEPGAGQSGRAAFAVARYVRQTALPEIGEAGQARLAAASVLVIGAGGLGCAVLPYLCAAGVGRLVVVDHDRVEESNLHRQPLYRMSDIGLPKAGQAAAALRALNPSVHVEATTERLTPANARALVKAADIIVDAADSFAVTYILSDTCSEVGKPLISASVLGLSGYAGVFCAHGAPGYRAVFPELPRQAASCATAGVLGTAVGVVGTLQAQLVLSHILQLEPAVAGRMVSVDLQSLRFSTFSFLNAKEDRAGFRFISRSDVNSDDLSVELRAIDETPHPAIPGSVRIAPDNIDQIAGRIGAAQRVVLCCRTGLRAWRAGNRLRAAGHENIVLLAAGD